MDPWLKAIWVVFVVIVISQLSIGIYYAVTNTGGSSENRLGGSSENRLGGSSENRLELRTSKDWIPVYVPHTSVTNMRVGAAPEPFSIIVSYYNNPEGLLTHAHLLSLYSDEWKDLVEFIVVDDGSQLKPARDYKSRFYEIMGENRANWDVKFIELTEDIGFNSGGAKNTGVLNAKHSKVLLIDMDVWLLPDKVPQFLHLHLEPKHFMGKFTVAFLISNHEGMEHPNLFFMNKVDFMNIGGYNEVFSGRYGVEDAEFTERLVHHGYQLLKEEKWVSWLINSGIGITSTERGKQEIRKESRENLKIIDRLKREGFPIPTSMALVPYKII